jgi:hypothetical protein
MPGVGPCALTMTRTYPYNNNRLVGTRPTDVPDAQIIPSQFTQNSGDPIEGENIHK